MDPTLIFFAAIAAFVCYRLYIELGAKRDDDDDETERELPLRRYIREQVEEGVAAREETAVQPEPVPEKVPAWAEDAKAAMPSFAAAEFLTGAKAAYEMIVQAFASGKITDVRPYLDPSVYGAFNTAIGARQTAGQISEVQFVGISKADVIETTIEKGFVRLTVEFESDQIRVMRDDKAAVIEGDPSRIDLVRDRWTFARPIKSNDPNWLLVATGGAAPAAV